MRLIWRRLFPFLLCFTLASCAPEPPSSPPSPLAAHTGNYEAGAVIRRGALLAEAVISQRSPDSCDVRFSSPGSLAGVVFAFRPEWATVSLGELEFRFDAGSVPAGAAAGLMRSALRAAMSWGAVDVAESDFGTSLYGTIDAGGFELLLSPEGRPLKLLIPEEELEIEFTDFTFID